ncbi:MAG: histidine kinase, partial [Saprospiraceae bacterium]|nr:histidine kinase [Saprospiraceae bacterium]
VVSIIPYISIQLKAVAAGFDILIHSPTSTTTSVPFYLDAAFYIAALLAIFTIWFGTRKLDPNESHEGLVAAIAFESVVKLLAFLSVGLFVTYGIFDGFVDLFEQASAVEDIQQLFTIKTATSSTWEWIWMVIISMSAIILLPRQFHMAVVENNNPNAVKTASWMFPLYLLLINIFVIPIAIGGLLTSNSADVVPDTYVLSLPLAFGKDYLALFVAIGGFSSATSMVIVAVIALSIMISNNIMVPLLLSSYTMRSEKVSNLSNRLLGIRRLSIVIVLLLAYGFFKAVSLQYALVSIGLISFTGIAQFMPVVVGGLYWKRATKAGAIAGLSIGILIWAFTLPLPTLVESGNISARLMSEGLWGILWLRPYALFGLEGMGQIAHAAFWSLLFNTGTYMIVSLLTRPSALEVTQADFFVDIYKYKDKTLEYERFKRRAKVADLVSLLNRFLGVKRANELLINFESEHQVKLSTIESADSEFINFTETHLAGAIGAASAKAIVSSTSTQDPIKIEEVFTILDQTQAVIRYSKELEQKSKELQDLTFQLTEANKQLQELDRMKADFITTVTHEIRTPLTSIKALAKILHDYPQLDLQKRQEYLDIITSESERLSRLINQVLDLEKIEAVPDVSMEI